MRINTVVSVLVLGFFAPQLPADLLSLCVKANGNARFSERCKPGKETQQFVMTNPQRQAEDKSVRAITRKQVFPVGYLASRDAWAIGPFCGPDEVLVSSGANTPIFAGGLGISCDATPAQPEHGSPVTAACSSISLKSDETGGKPIPLTQEVEVYLSTVCAKK